jgi:hypothetical protein
MKLSNTQSPIFAVLAGLQTGFLVALVTASVTSGCSEGSFCLRAMEIIHALTLAALGAGPLHQLSPRDPSRHKKGERKAVSGGRRGRSMRRA